METEVIKLTIKQHDRLDVINKANAGFITVKEAAEKLGISERQIQRLKKGVKDSGPAVLVHKNSNRKPAHAISQKIKDDILKIRKQPGYKESNFRHFQELLETKHQIIISYSALYRLLKRECIRSPMKRRRFKPHRRRKRCPQPGLLIQVDASSYEWLGTGEKFSLHGAIDDATSQVVGLYICKNECMQGYFEIMRRMINVYGIPGSIYADRHTIFRSPNEDKAKSIDASKNIKVNETQFGRALSELGIQIIAARSPQAKGRIERLWETLQSRLPVELIINDMVDIDSANEFLNDYIFALNSELAVEPQDADNAFLPLEEEKNLDHILCVKEERTLDSGQIFSYKGKLFQIEDSPYAKWLPPKAKITVMVSPNIGIKAAYKNYVFETKPVSAKRTVEKVVAPHSEPKEPRIYRSSSAWEPKDGILWKPGLPTYRESLEIIYDIFSRPYAKPKKQQA